MLIVDAMEADKVRELLEAKVESMSNRHEEEIGMYDKAAAYAPACASEPKAALVAITMAAGPGCCCGGGGAGFEGLVGRACAGGGGGLGGGGGEFESEAAR